MVAITNPSWTALTPIQCPGCAGYAFGVRT